MRESHELHVDGKYLPADAVVRPAVTPEFPGAGIMHPAGFMKRTCDYLIEASHVVTQDDERRVIRDGAVAVGQGVILAVGSAAALCECWQAHETISLGEAAMLPGLMNAHTHIPMSALRGYSDDKNLMDWLQQDIFPIEAHLSSEIVRAAAAFSCAEMIRTGTTALYDMYMLEDGVFDAVAAMGMRAVIGESVTRFFPSLAARDAEEAFDLIRAQAERWKGHPRIRQSVVPHAIYTTDAGFLRRCRELADETGALFGMHLSETEQETRDCVAAHGMRPVAYCRELGLLRPDATFFHAVDVNDDDLDMVAEGGCALVHNPASNMKLASGAAPIGRMLDHGIGVGLGTDGPASNNAQNMVREMYVAALLQKVHGLDPTALSAQTALDMATRGGAAAFHLPGAGRLEVGARADLIALDLTSPNMQPVHHLVSNIVYAATGLENRLTMVDGRLLYRDGVYHTCDYEALRDGMREIVAWVHRKNR